MNKGKETKPHIGIFGRRNNGKSSLINRLAGQDIAIVSDFAGTTTDPVKKSIEIGGIGPVILVDTAGIDDEGELGKKRIAKSLSVIPTLDLALLIIAQNTFGTFEEDLITAFSKNDLPFLIIHNKSDIEPLNSEFHKRITSLTKVQAIDFSCIQNYTTGKLIQQIRLAIPESAYKSTSLLGDLLSYGDVVLLITPIDDEAPEGRMILPQVQTIRDTLDNEGIVMVVKEREAEQALKMLVQPPKLVVTDSQVFLKADAMIPTEIPLTSFSILLARQRGDFNNYLIGTPKIAELKDGDKILLLESCTHHVSCDDIGRIKIPRWLSQFTGKNLDYDVVSGLSTLPRSIQEYALVIQCGGCVITRKQVINRLKPAVDAGIPVTNYGMAIAWVHGIYQRAIQPFVKIEINSDDYL